MLTKRAAMQMRSLQPAFVQTFPKIIRPPKSDRLLGKLQAYVEKECGDSRHHGELWIL
jgi:hypothetical protein